LCIFGYTAKYTTIPLEREEQVKENTLRKRAQVLKAMGHPSRLLILEAVAGGEKCVGDLQNMVGSDFSTVSRHLSVLKNAGILEDRKQGSQVFYSLRVPCILDFFGCVDAVIGGSVSSDSQRHTCQRSFTEASACNNGLE
jgi:ArsR family transcriptional regulator